MTLTTHRRKIGRLEIILNCHPRSGGAADKAFPFTFPHPVVRFLIHFSMTTISAPKPDCISHDMSITPSICGLGEKLNYL
jgi:hypothetical protein